MNAKEVEKLLTDVKNGETSIEKALEVLKNFPIQILDLPESIITVKCGPVILKLFTVQANQLNRSEKYSG